MFSVIFYEQEISYTNISFYVSFQELKIVSFLTVIRLELLRLKKKKAYPYPLPPSPSIMCPCKKSINLISD